MATTIIKNGLIINRGESVIGDLLIKNDRIDRVGGIIDQKADVEIDASGNWVIPGIIDDQVHFREPGLTHKANIFTESTAAVAGGTTTFMEMPNVKPPSVTQEALEAKYQIGARDSLANYSFFVGATNDNLEEVLKTNPANVCGIKIFMGSSTGNMLVDNQQTLENLFSKAHMLIATHCEDEATVRANTAKAYEKYGEDVPMHLHPVIRSREGCYISSSMAVEMAKRFNTRLHILHISTADEIALFDATTPLREKRITAEACVHHLTFNSDDYHSLGGLIKCNPAIKDEADRQAIFQAVLDNHIDIIATDHAPHTWEEKQNNYANCPSGLPLVQHSLNLMMLHEKAGRISREKMVEKMCHAPADCFRVKDRGFLDEGKFADVVIIDPDQNWTVQKSNILHKCGWSPLEGRQMHGKVLTTLINGHIAYNKGTFDRSRNGMRLEFEH